MKTRIGKAGAYLAAASVGVIVVLLLDFLWTTAPGWKEQVATVTLGLFFVGAACFLYEETRRP